MVNDDQFTHCAENAQFSGCFDSPTLRSASRSPFYTVNLTWLDIPCAGGLSYPCKRIQAYEKGGRMNCLPFLGLEVKSENGRFFMAGRHAAEVRRAAVELFSRGHGETFVANRLGLSRAVVEQWFLTYRAVGSEALLAMGTAHREYDFETKVAAASAVVDLGRPKPEVMAEFGIASKSPLNAWCSKHREGGVEALRPRPKGRPKAEPAPKTREEELEREVERLRAQVAYLKKSIALKAELGLLPGSGQRP